MTDANSDGNILSETGPASQPVAPASSPSGGSLADAGEALRSLESSIDNGSDDTSPLPAWERGQPHTEPKDLDSASYDKDDPRSLLQPKPEAEQSPPEPVGPQMPKAWGKDALEAWNRLDPATQQLVAKNEAQREAHLNAQRSEVDKLRHQTQAEIKAQYEADIRAAQQYRQEAERVYHQSDEEVMARVAISEGISQFQQKWGVQDVTGEQLQQLHQSHPELAKQVSEDLQQLHQAAVRRNEIAERNKFAAEKAATAAQQQRDQQAAMRDAQWRAEQNRIAESKIEELKDPRRATEFRRAVLETAVEHYGYTPNELFARPLDARDQQVLADAVKWRQAQVRALRVAPVNPPRPQSGGVNRNIQGSNDLAGAADRGDMISFVKLRTGKR